MDVDFSNSRNATILRYLQNPYDFITGPKADKRAQRWQAWSGAAKF
jgi:hypothetical protein